MGIDTLRRREQIIDRLCLEGSVRVEQLRHHFGVSSVTIRNDLRYLEQRGCALRSYGGAMLNQQFVFDRPLQDKGRLNRDVKSRIAARAAALVQDGDTLIIDSGSTTAQIAPFLKVRRHLVVVTNALNIACELAGYEQIDVLVLGGNVRQNAYSLYGQTAEQQLRQYHFDRLFLGVDGFDLICGITTPHAGEAQLNRVMCDVASEIIAVVDASKFGRKSFCTIRGAAQIHRVITDSRIPEGYHRALCDLGVDVIIADG
ncbi:DeoR/GlpR transcriptional regulator [Edwardsiella ictaluri]|uniref:Transcriptional regulator, DeoR family n=2 Tax=Edwardsiella ictaluri TaxID=67780 RepID=C5B9J4_EDWI9|nr:transcriptional repressor AgaR [Edwardsiella ictaluri]ACR67995.1 transcriptional regulator, DeoR family [Edwardsiella ictaluri 93-146]ARD40424.1 DeoR family transcriptional regulator [Edwardsiella ictaluri]AVZ81588.1 DeoR/GlpR transcriptional regulator [Edwardsiella ictaluri]EKS7762078.1 DeoR/GlpR transcriptional regulator [Edwardsiella ictaluri]EKS7768888.1 DeoR/GlpR transcriptional regulator [Edwardsiella ictaluri]